ncbi:hypothetical protein U1Q18_021232 [Sarracenia purpurea var. burkii]
MPDYAAKWRTKIGHNICNLRLKRRGIFSALRVAGRGQWCRSDRQANLNTTGLLVSLPLYNEDVGDELELNQRRREGLLGRPSAELKGMLLDLKREVTFEVQWCSMPSSSHRARCRAANADQLPQALSGCRRAVAGRSSKGRFRCQAVSARCRVVAAGVEWSLALEEAAARGG